MKLDGDEWAWIGEQKFLTFKSSQGIRFVTLQDTRAALIEESARIRKAFLEEFGEPGSIEWRHFITVLDRICPVGRKEQEG